MLKYALFAERGLFLPRLAPCPNFFPPPPTPECWHVPQHEVVVDPFPFVPTLFLKLMRLCPPRPFPRDPSCRLFSNVFCSHTTFTSVYTRALPSTTLSYGTPIGLRLSVRSRPCSSVLPLCGAHLHKPIRAPVLPSVCDFHPLTDFYTPRCFLFSHWDFGIVLTLF